jgi:DNA-binding LacI/PurR family transcriptional regulator
MGQLATNKLFGRLSKTRPAEPELTEVIPKLIIRESTAAPCE